MVEIPGSCVKATQCRRADAPMHNDRTHALRFATLLPVNDDARKEKKESDEVLTCWRVFKKLTPVLIAFEDSLLFITS